jgi:hypothetical protein
VSVNARPIRPRIDDDDLEPAHRGRENDQDHEPPPGRERRGLGHVVHPRRVRFDLVAFVFVARAGFSRVAFAVGFSRVAGAFDLVAFAATGFDCGGAGAGSAGTAGFTARGRVRLFARDARTRSSGRVFTTSSRVRPARRAIRRSA